MSNPTLTDILEWSQDRPDWQRDALRRLFVAGVLTPSDVAALTTICKAAHGLADAATPEVLTADHLAITESNSLPVSLTSVTHHRGVNALALEQTVTFGPQLTVVYGANAAGKSGYTRILKQACRSRAREDTLLGDVLGGEAPVNAQVTISFREGGNEPVNWKTDDPPSAALAAISVFDTHCAPVYLKDKTDVAFRPFGLDVFDRLSTACAELRKILEAEQRELQQKLPRLPAVGAETRARKLIESLTSLTRMAEVTALATLSPDDNQRLKELRDRKRDFEAADPKRRAQELLLKARRIDSLVSHAESLAETLSTTRLQELHSVADDLRVAEEALSRLRDAAFTADLLAGTGGQRWRDMWDATEKFSGVALPDGTFPDVSADARCPFCQQPIGPESATRLNHLKEYVSSSAQAEVRRAETRIADLTKRVRDVQVERTDLAAAHEELDGDDRDLGQRLTAFLTDAGLLRTAVLGALEHKSPIPSEGLPPTIAAALKATASSLRERATQLSSESQKFNPAEDAELADLESRLILHQHLTVVEDEIERQKRLAAYTQCLDDTGTQPITRKSTELTTSLVTAQLRSMFQSELKALAFTHLAVELRAAGGARGALFHRVVFQNAPGVPVTNVLSEGESRTLSLASFLTELTTAPAASAIIFDDPVSSLDHVWRERIARRLVAEARTRQVIVFTHDILFLQFLRDHASREGVACAHQYVRRDVAAGVCSPELPWIAMNTSDRIGALKNMWQAVEKVYRTEGPNAYEREGREMFGLLREAWEHAVGEVLLNDVIDRFRVSIQTQKTRSLYDIEKTDCETIDDAMTECSRWLRGHDPAAADAGPFPAPDALLSRIQQLDDWVQRIRARRKKKKS